MAKNYERSAVRTPSGLCLIDVKKAIKALTIEQRKAEKKLAALTSGKHLIAIHKKRDAAFLKFFRAFRKVGARVMKMPADELRRVLYKGEKFYDTKHYVQGAYCGLKMPDVPSFSGDGLHEDAVRGAKHKLRRITERLRLLRVTSAKTVKMTEERFAAWACGAHLGELIVPRYSGGNGETEKLPPEQS